MASSLGLPLVADSSYHHSWFYIGMPQGLLQELPENSEVGLSFEGEKFYRLQGKGADVV